MRVRTLVVLAVSQLLALSALAQPTPSIPSLSNDQINRLNNGEILVDGIIGEAPVGDAMGVIDAPPEQVMALIRDFERHSEIFDDIALSELVGRDGEYTIHHGITNTPWPMADREWTLRAWGGAMEVDGMPVLVSTWEYIPGSGNIVDTGGYWLCMPWGDGSKTLVRYHIMVDLGSWLPDFLIEWSTENMLPNKINAVRDHI